MLNCWRLPEYAGDPLGCVATTYTFSPAIFDEHCLARFLGIESDPNREDLAYLLERECRLGAVFAGVLVDQSQAGVAHSLRWDVLPVRIPGGIQHAKLSLLVWRNHVRLIVASANLTEPGYRTNYEVAGVVNFSPTDAQMPVLQDALFFLRGLLDFVPGASEDPPEVHRLRTFLNQVETQIAEWPSSARGGATKQVLACSLPATNKQDARGALDEALKYSRAAGGAPSQVWIASPFFDPNEDTNRAVATLCKRLAAPRQVHLFAPGAKLAGSATFRMDAPRSLLSTASRYSTEMQVSVLPKVDSDKNVRPWHAKLMAFHGDGYVAIMIGSSNFTAAGLGLDTRRNAEANLVTVVRHERYSSNAKTLAAMWPACQNVDEPETAEWAGPVNSLEPDMDLLNPLLPSGFVGATFCAGDNRHIALRFDPTHLPERWTIIACGRDEQALLNDADWHAQGCPSIVSVSWLQIQPPERLLVRWDLGEAFLIFNVEDAGKLPAPEPLAQMTSEDLLDILAASDPSAAFRVWASHLRRNEVFDDELDAATPADLDPLRRYDLQATFLHRIRRRARVLARLRENLERPIWSMPALEWQLRGPIGIAALADRLALEFAHAVGTGDRKADEALLTLADFLIVLREVNYCAAPGAVSESVFNQRFGNFLAETARDLDRAVQTVQEQANLSVEALQFWQRTLTTCL